MKKTIVAGAAAIGLVALLAGCGTPNNTTTNSTTGSNSASNSVSSTVTTDMKDQFVSVTASAQTAIDDFTTGKSLLGPMSTKTIGGTAYSVVATSKSDLNDLEQSYLDFLTQAQVNNLFSHVSLKAGDYVFQSMTSSGDTNNWFKATVKSAVPQGNGYLVTLSVPQTDGSSAQTQTAVIQKDASGHWVYAGT